MTEPSAEAVAIANSCGLSEESNKLALAQIIDILSQIRVDVAVRRAVEAERERSQKYVDAIKEAIADFHTLAYAKDGDFDDLGLRNFGTICERQLTCALDEVKAQEAQP